MEKVILSILIVVFLIVILRIYILLTRRVSAQSFSEKAFPNMLSNALSNAIIGSTIRFSSGSNKRVLNFQVYENEMGKKAIDWIVPTKIPETNLLAELKRHCLSAGLNCHSSKFSNNVGCFFIDLGTLNKIPSQWIVEALSIMEISETKMAIEDRELINCSRYLKHKHRMVEARRDHTPPRHDVNHLLRGELSLLSLNDRPLVESGETQCL